MSGARGNSAGSIGELVASGNLKCRVVSRGPLRRAAGWLSQHKNVERVPDTGEA